MTGSGSGECDRTGAGRGRGRTSSSESMAVDEEMKDDGEDSGALKLKESKDSVRYVWGVGEGDSVTWVNRKSKGMCQGIS